MKNNRISNLAEFRRWVKIRLVEKEISQNELARQMGIPHARISEATHGKQSGNKYIMGHNYDYRDIVPKFRRNRPQNDMETAQIVTMLANDLSRETRLQLMPGVENVQDELRKLEEEKNKEQEDFGVYKNFTKAFQGAADRTEAVTDEPEGT